MGTSASLASRFRAELIGRIIATLAGTLLIFLLARLLDPSGYGLLFLSISVFSVAKTFSNLGIAKSSARYISEYKEKDPGQIPHIFEKSFIINILTITVVTIVFVMFHAVIASRIGESELRPFLLVGSLFIAFGSLTTYVRFISQGIEDIKLSSIVNALDQGTRLLFAVGFIILGYGAIGALGGFILGSFFASTVGLVALYTRYYRGAEKSDSMEPGLIRRILEYNVPLTITTLSGRLDKDIDTILIGLFLNSVAVGYYVLSKQIVMVVGMPARALGFSISPTYGKQKATNQLETAAKMFEKTFSHTLLLYVPAAAGLFFTASPAVELVFGPEYTGAVPVLQVLAFYVVLSAITKITDHPLDYLGRAKIRSIAKSVASVSNALLNVLLIPTIGVVGAAIATVLTHGFYVTVKLYIVYDELPVDVRRLLSDVTTISSVTVGMCLVIWLLLPYVSSLFSLVFIILVAVVTWGGLSLATGIIDYRSVKTALLKMDDSVEVNR